MFKKVLFQLHWFFGITAGLVLALMGVTGALYSFQEEILLAINPQMAVTAQPGSVLEPGEMIERLQAQGIGVSGLYVDTEGGQPARVFLTPPPGERRGGVRFVDPYTAESLGEPRGMAFFGLMLQLHRFLAMGQTGRQITGACTIALVFFCLSGLYLRWPRRVFSWRAWLTFDWAKKGRAFNWDLHAVVGTWCLPLYLCAALTGLYWSYDWYRSGLETLLSDTPREAGEGRGRRGPPPDGQPKPEVNYANLWQGIQRTAGDKLGVYSLQLPNALGQPARVFFMLRDAEHTRAFNQMQLDPLTGEAKQVERYADKSFKAQLLASVYALHTGEYFGMPGRVLMMVASLLMPLFFITGWLLYLDRRRKKRAALAARQALAGGEGGESWLVAFASQSGFAEQLAWQTAGQLQAAGMTVEVQPLARIDTARLSTTPRALLVLSTFGDGEAPDSARGVERQWLAATLDLPQLRYAVLALGDRQYSQFCGFARRLDDWLYSRGALRLGERVEVDGDDEAALLAWQRQLADLTGVQPLPVQHVPFDGWTLRARECLNPHGQGQSTWLIGLQPPTGVSWEAGDILEIVPRNGEAQVRHWLHEHGLQALESVVIEPLGHTLGEALSARQLPFSASHLVGLHAQALLDALVPLASREYSIASLPEEGKLELIVRQQHLANGQLGAGSGWVTAHLPVGAQLLARVRRNSGFHAPVDDRPVILIGNGTGLAGLRSLLKARIAAGHTRNWLLFGERSVEHDFYCGEELQGWANGGQLQRLDLAFSRDQAQRIYVQDRLREATEELRAWIADGAAVYVCGSLQGMAAGVDQVLREVLGEAVVEELVEQGRYRRDVY
ncbi:sulfite reductase (NADPH) flavoprotein alpha-component [Pseudomonas sp. BIGb0408]|uniref:Sulfite reductase (NADPH) flavoprotein alpha-component n=1 Tax=Phytopseudomonas flavescens TaxID=29435 RepID=A0A7Y9XS50_9GAMM|nr:sulfite reductase flavoprotein subunit alpha [Pseudomonas sp. BIGb0408]MCW2294273.1 sulfite reductase (NADPH) flavoprotein alpha-component [Pseudomonas sp. BIGb0408]NYH76453.1 sulfite reductase (NADPH) flavoprotein alpha-component [Pseudomonas flavescens]